MFLTVRYNYGDNWTALFFIAPATPQTPPVANEHPYLWQGTPGYDGQGFHLMAHDPWLRYGSPELLGMQPLRYVRILVPMLAWLLAFGRDAWIDPAYYLLIVASGFLGAYWTARWTMRYGLPAWLGFVFIATPAAIAGADRMLCDITLAALCAGFAVYSDQGPRWKIFIVLAAAALTRETGVLLIAGYGAYSFVMRRWSDVGLSIASALPFAAWAEYVRARSTGPAMFPQVAGWIPFQGFVERFVNFSAYPLPPLWSAAAVIADHVSLIAIAAVFAMVTSLAIRRQWTPAVCALYALAIGAIFLRIGGAWAEAYSFGRLLTPLMLLAAFVYLPRAGWIAFAPVVVVALHVAAWLGRQLAGILHGLVSEFLS